MAQIKSYPLIKTLRADASSFVQHFRNGRRVRAGRGLAFWFMPDGASITEIPVDDRQMTFTLKGQSADFQELTVQGTVVWRVSDPQVLGDRVDFTIDLEKGRLTGQPIDQINTVIGGLVRQFAYSHLKQQGVRDLLKAGIAPLQELVSKALAGETTLGKMGLEIVGINIANLAPTSELARALQAPTFESLQQQADEASFARRALAVDKERAIAENELNNQIELASRQKDLIQREAANARSKVEAEVENKKINAEADAAMTTILANSQAQSIRTVDIAKAETERARMDVYNDASPAVLLAMAAQEFASKVKSIDNLTITPDMLGSLLGQLGGIMGGRAKAANS
jgi:regulator of protease activity HflC (stomatin/prohibitin superfamily)